MKYCFSKSDVSIEEQRYCIWNYRLSIAMHLSWREVLNWLLKMLKMGIIIAVKFYHVNVATKTATFYVSNQNRKEKQLSFNTTKLLRIPHLRAGFFSLHALRRFTDLLNPDREVRKQSRIKSECNNKTWKQDI